MKWTTSATVPGEQNYADKLMEGAELCKLIAGASLLSRSSKIVFGKRGKAEVGGKETRGCLSFLHRTTQATAGNVIRTLDWDLWLIKTVIKKY